VADTINLEFLAAQQVQILTELRDMRSEMTEMRSEMTEMRDDVRVLTAMAIRQDNRAKRTLDLLQQTIESAR
jgi:transcriptional regulator